MVYFWNIVWPFTIQRITFFCWSKDTFIHMRPRCGPKPHHSTLPLKWMVNVLGRADHHNVSYACVVCGWPHLLGWSPIALLNVVLLCAATTANVTFAVVFPTVSVPVRKWRQCYQHFGRHSSSGIIQSNIIIDICPKKKDTVQTRRLEVANTQNAASSTHFWCGRRMRFLAASQLHMYERTLRIAYIL